jgi:hypothetical protein
MLLLVFRALDAVFAVVVAIVVSLYWGATNLAKLITVVITASVVALFEWLLLWAPKHSRRIRLLLDPRATFAGVWLQENVHAYGRGRAQDDPNHFAVFSVNYRAPSDTYEVDGRAYSVLGKEHASFHSFDTLNFAKDGRSMTYLFEGEITNPGFAAEDPRRMGLVRLDLSSDHAGRGRVEHVGKEVTLTFDLRRITKEWLTEHHLGRFDPAKLCEPEIRDEFANALASADAGRKATA